MLLLFSNASFACSLRLSGDVYIEFINRDRGATSSGRKMFAVGFNTACERGEMAMAIPFLFPAIIFKRHLHPLIWALGRLDALFFTDGG